MAVWSTASHAPAARPAADQKPAAKKANPGRPEDSDGRWNETDLGRFLASVITLPDGPVHKGLSIRVGEEGEAAVCYDTEHLKLRAAWAGGFLKFDAARFGIIFNPAIDGELLFSVPEGPGWQADDLHYIGMYVHGDRVVFRYLVDGIDVLESPRVARLAGESCMMRDVWMAAGKNKPRALVRGGPPDPLVGFDGREGVAEFAAFESGDLERWSIVQF